MNLEFLKVEDIQEFLDINGYSWTGMAVASIIDYKTFDDAKIVNNSNELYTKAYISLTAEDVLHRTSGIKTKKGRKFIDCIQVISKKKRRNDYDRYDLWLTDEICHLRSIDFSLKTQKDLSKKWRKFLKEKEPEFKEREQAELAKKQQQAKEQNLYKYSIIADKIIEEVNNTTNQELKPIGKYVLTLRRLNALLLLTELFYMHQNNNKPLIKENYHFWRNAGFVFKDIHFKYYGDNNNKGKVSYLRHTSQHINSVLANQTKQIISEVVKTTKFIETEALQDLLYVSLPNEIVLKKDVLPEIYKIEKLKSDLQELSVKSTEQYLDNMLYENSKDYHKSLAKLHDTTENLKEQIEQESEKE